MRGPKIERHLLVVAAAVLCASGAHAADDILIADFEGDSYGNWKVTGEAFGPGPAGGTLPGQMDVSGFEGARLVNSYYGGDDTTGTLTSPAFKIDATRSGRERRSRACTRAINSGTERGFTT